MGTNYYVNTPSCPNACEHCSETERRHLGKSFGNGGFLFRAEPEWPRPEALAYWVRRALSGTINDEYGQPGNLAELLALAQGAPINGCFASSAHDFTSCGYDFSIRAFS